MLASARSVARRATCCAAVSRTTRVPCTWSRNTGVAPSVVAKRRRFSATAIWSSGSSVCAFRFSESYGAALTPPTRVVISAPVPRQASRRLEERHLQRSGSTISSGISFGVGAGRRLGAGERLVRHARRVHAHHVGHVVQSRT
jgi:hypothetical protein